MPDRNLLAEYISAEPSGQNVLAGVRPGVLAGHPNPDAPQMSWEFQGPLVKNWLLQTLMFGGMLPLGGRSPAGAARGNDYVMANRVDRLASRRPDDTMPVTGGTIEWGGRERPHSNSSYGLALRHHDDILPATQGRNLAPYYPVRQDYPRASNVNDAPIPASPPNFRVIPGGRTTE